jgi:flavin-dependent dehydrogenase
VRRTTLHAALLDAARRAGIEIVAERATDVRTQADGVVVDGRRAAYLAVADGLHSALRRRLDLAQPPSRRRQPRWGTRAHYAVEPWTDHVEVHWAAHSEAYVTPVGPRLVGVAVLSGSQSPYAEQLGAFPALAARLPADTVTSVRGAGPLRQRTSRRTAGRALLVGDAAGYVDALTGEGIAVSLACARALVDCIAAGDPQAYERRWLAASRRYRLITSTLLWARRRPALAGQIVPLAARFPGAFGLALKQLAR